MAEERYKNGAQNLCDFIGLVPSKKRKRRTSFTPQALEILNEYFERSTHPTGELHCHVYPPLLLLLGCQVSGRNPSPAPAKKSQESTEE